MLLIWFQKEYLFCNASVKIEYIPILIDISV